MQTKKGQSIEDASMQMIEDEIGSHQYNEKELISIQVKIKRITASDFNKLIIFLELFLVPLSLVPLCLFYFLFF